MTSNVENTKCHNDLWTSISDYIFNLYGFRATARQCQAKWYALKQGYENSKRLLQGNPNGYAIRSPNSFDRTFYNEIVDEFWIQTRNYFIIIIFFYDIISYIYIIYFIF